MQITGGGPLVLRKVFALTPAVAMRAPAPTDYSRSAGFGRWMKAVLDQPTRMVIRNMTRSPGRALGGGIGIAAGMAFSVAMLCVLAAFNVAIDQSYSIVDRSDASMAFDTPLSERMIYNLQSIDGVFAVEPFRSVSVILRNGVDTYRGAIQGMIAEPQMYRAMAKDGSAIRLRSDGLFLGTALADKLKVRAGGLSVDGCTVSRPAVRLHSTLVA
ncbi:MAG: hypothetical protein ACOH2H_22240 [Cypionkella sp.]